jgi:hypothetical protein
MKDKKEVLQQVGEMLKAYLKSGPTSPTHADEVVAAIFDLARPLIVTPEKATAAYQAGCKGFLDEVIRVRGMPTREIVSGSKSASAVGSSSGNDIKNRFDSLVPKIREQFKWCVENYKKQSKSYFDDQTEVFQEIVRAFLRDIPAGGTKNTFELKEITRFKKELSSLIGWEELFGVYKAASFPAEVDYIFGIEKHPLAAVWRYNQLDTQGEYKKTYNHERLDGRVYAVADNWAIQKGLMVAGPDGYVDDITRPCQEVGCMCSLSWIYSLRELPDAMVTPKARAELPRVRAIIDDEAVEKPSILGKVFGWFKRG